MQYALVMDTCGGEGYVALCGVSTPSAASGPQRWLPARETQENLLPAVQAVLAEAGVPLSSIAAVVLVNGPGSFTGVRIGLATAKGLCEAAGSRLVTLSRLSVLAQAARVQTRQPAQPVYAWLDAGRGDVYAGVLQPGHHNLQTEVLLPLSHAMQLAEGATVAVYEVNLRGKAPEALLVHAESFATALCMAAVAAVQAGDWADAALADALYLRIPDAELALREKRL